MLSFAFYPYGYAECRYALCYYAECRGAQQTRLRINLIKLFVVICNLQFIIKS
jgi:hypothetical protein